MAEQVIKDREFPATENGEAAVVTRPRVDILETEQEVLLLADLPGVKPSDVDVRFENGELSVHGRRNPAHADKRRALWEYEPAHYHRSFRLTEDVAADKIEAELKNGVLKVRLPKAEAAKPRRIAVKGE
ncbi:MAG TPA: Hsp20/alpha crystallin family protein [Gemmataceae bacterium]|jgi:HSP20 family protein|nr:Hsp20/alpha crystallin family protein [Gemmataceae bacterium]